MSKRLSPTHSTRTGNDILLLTTLGNKIISNEGTIARGVLPIRMTTNPINITKTCHRQRSERLVHFWRFLTLG